MRTRMVGVLVAMTMVATAGAASAGKPSKKAAMAAAKAWLEAREDTLTAASTALPFALHVFNYSPDEVEGTPAGQACEGSSCVCTVNATDDAALATLSSGGTCLDLVHADAAPTHTTASKALKQLAGPLGAHKKTVKQLDKTGRLLQVLDPMCGADGGWVLLAVTQGKDKVAKVSAVFANHGFCGE